MRYGHQGANIPVRNVNSGKIEKKGIKYFIKTYLSKEDYNAIFRDISDKANYVSYVYNAPSENDRNKYKKCLQEDFCKFLKPVMEIVVFQ